MSLDPRDSRRRGRSKSPGRRRDDDERSHSKVRAPSPPSSKYDYHEAEPPSRGKVYDYEDRSTRDRDPPAVVDAEPRGYGYDPRGSDPRIDPYGGQYRTDAPPATGGRPEYGSGGGYTPTTRPEYSMPGAFTSMPSAPDEGSRYATSGGPGGREKDYYAEKGYGEKGYGEKGYGEKGYGDKGHGKRDEYVRDVSPPRKEKKERSRYEDVSPPRKEKKERARYEDVSPPRREKMDRARYEDVSPPRGSRYEDDKYKHGGRDYDGKRYEEDRYGKEDKYGKDKYKEDKYGKNDSEARERGASFNISAGQHSFSGGVNVAHGHEKSQYVRPPSPSDFAPPGALGKPPSYAEPPKWEYAQPDERLTYSRTQETAISNYNTRPVSPPYTANPSSRHGSNARYHDDSARSSKSQIFTVEPGLRNKRDASPGPGAYRRDASPNPAINRGMHSLSVSTGHHGGASLSLATAPGSPLLESYHGTYQSISPMPSPLMIANTPHSDVNLIEALSPQLSSDDERREKKKRNARFHDPVDEAKILAQALKGEKRAPDTEPLIEILPGLTHEQILDLRVEYKRIVKTGSEKKGVNIAKHIKLRLKEEDPSLMKACYACALGKWESEAYWANFWYQGEKSRRELLIESLMGRTNREIREIKEGFADKKYSDSLTKCMKTELREDKFKKAVLLVLDEKKMEERPGYALDRDLVEDDVKDLYKAVRSEKGGETAMINIVVVRSDAHLREVLRAYEATYRANFAREMLKKSGNLVGELLAHILNGVINKPVRDALLVQHALGLSKSDSIRTELLISRLVRYHWDRPHMEAVKREYRNRYKIDMQKAVAEGTRGEWGHFCEMLCVRRMGDEVREVSRVQEYHRVERRER